MKIRILLAALLAAACARPAPRSQTPTPTPAPRPATTAASAPTRDSIRTAAAVPTPQAKPMDPPRSLDSATISRSDVTRKSTEIFGDSILTDSAATPDSATGPEWDIDVHPYESTARVDRYIRLFTGSAKEHIEARLSRGTRYEGMIRQMMRDGGLPEDLYYLALVESGFDPNAYSRAAAVGMWQFMTSTARDMGMRVDWWIDERRDPVRSTRAAIRFIKGLKEEFGSLYLAAAAYNGGPVRISRGLSRYADELEGTTGDDLFFALADKDYLRNETREYVPQLIAAALIAKEPERYGLKITTNSPFVYDSVRVGPAVPLAAIASAANTTVSQIQEFNPQILRGMTPPKDSVLIRLPMGSAATFADSFNALPDDARIAFTRVTSKKGDNFESIAHKRGIGTRVLASFNPSAKQLKSGNLAPGQTILVPTSAVASAATLAPDPAIERYSHSRSSVTYVVRNGESLGSIAKKYHTTTAALMRANGLKHAVIFPGQTIIVGGKATSSSRKATTSIASASSPSRTVALMTVGTVHSAKPSSEKAASAKHSSKSTKTSATGKKKSPTKSSGSSKKSVSKKK